MALGCGGVLSPCEHRGPDLAVTSLRAAWVVLALVAGFLFGAFVAAFVFLIVRALS